MVKNINMLTIFVMLNVIGSIICMTPSECNQALHQKGLVSFNNSVPYPALGWEGKVEQYCKDYLAGIKLIDILRYYVTYYRTVSQTTPNNYCNTCVKLYGHL